MDDYSKTISYRFRNVLNMHDISLLQSNLSKLEGINSFKISPESIIIDFVRLRLTEESVKEMIKNMGFPVKEEKKKKKGIFSRFIKNLAESNRESFGNKRLECCDLNHR